MFVLLDESGKNPSLIEMLDKSIMSLARTYTPLYRNRPMLSLIGINSKL